MQGCPDIMLFLQYPSLATQILLVVFFAPAIRAQCEQTTHASGGLDETVNFYICLTPAEDYENQAITVQHDENMEKLEILYGTTVNGWSWEIASYGDEIFFKISCQIRSILDYDTSYTVSYIYYGDNSPSTPGLIVLTIELAGPPQLCQIEDSTAAHVLSTPLGWTGNMTLCIASATSLTISKVSLPSCQGHITDASTLSVSAVQDTSNPIVYRLELRVSRLTLADIGQWTVTVYNDDDTSLSLLVTVAAVGPPLLCDDSQASLNMNYWASNTTSVIVYSTVDLTLGTIKKTSNETTNTRNCTNLLDVSISKEDKTAFTHELVLHVICDDASTWIVPVTNSYGTIDIDITVRDINQGSADETSNDDESFKWLALGLGLVLLLVVIVFVVVVVFLVRRTKRLSVTKTRKGSAVVDSRELTVRENYASLTGTRQQPSNYETINNPDVDPTQNGPVAPVTPVATPGGEYAEPNIGDLTSQTRSDYVDATTAGGNVTADGGNTAVPNGADNNVSTTSRYETVSADFPFTRATRTISGGTSDRGRPEMASGAYDPCNSKDIESPNVDQRMGNGSYVNHPTGRESCEIRENGIYTVVGSTYMNAA